MSWGEQLWDQEKLIFENVDHGIRFLSRCRHFMAARAALEQAFARDMLKLVKSYADEAKKPDCGDETSTMLGAWRTVLQESEYVAKQHESIAENITSRCVEGMKALGTEHKAHRKAHESELHQLQRTLAASRSKYDSARKAYEKVSKEAADLNSKYDKLQGSRDTPRAKLDKAKAELDKVRAEAERLRNDYIVVTASFNKQQREYYSNEQLRVFDTMQQQTQERLTQHAAFLQSYSQVAREVIPTIVKCLDTMDLAVQAIDPAEDTQHFMRQTKSGLAMPSDKVVGESSMAQATTSYSVQKVHERRVKKSKLFKTTARKKTAIRDDFGHLPPEQRRNAIRKKVQELTDAHAKAHKSKMATAKTVDLYRAQPEFGDEKTIAKAEKEIKELDKELEKLANELYKFQLYLSVIEGTEMPPPPEGYKGDDGPGPGGGGAADWDAGSVASYNSAATGASAGPGFAAHSAPLPAEDDDEAADFSDDFSDDDGEAAGPGESTTDEPGVGAAASAVPAPPVPPPAQAYPRARMLYEFAGSNDGELSVGENAVVEVLVDDGSGWVHARFEGREGYVPATYLQTL